MSVEDGLPPICGNFYDVGVAFGLIAVLYVVHGRRAFMDGRGAGLSSFHDHGSWLGLALGRWALVAALVLGG